MSEFPELILATHNPSKARELAILLMGRFRILSLKDMGIELEIPEPHLSLEANAVEKSRTIHRLTGRNCLGEDTGLDVEALGGAPGVFSARYAGPDQNSRNNIQKLLRNLDGISLRTARFRTVISLILETKEYCFEGSCRGRIVRLPRGSGGFGYDPVFQPEGSQKTFAQMDTEEKNHFSHRARAARQLLDFLHNNT